MEALKKDLEACRADLSIALSAATQ
jgi:hypothetical protein